MDDALNIVEQRMNQPTARGLGHAVSRAIGDGALTAGTKLPPIRVVAKQLGLSPTTVSAAWSLLARSGAIRTDGRRGTTVAHHHSAGSARYRQALEGRATFDLDLSTGVPDPALLPDLTHALQALTTVATPGSYLDSPVLPELLTVLRADWPYPAEEITVVDGAMDALDLAAQTLIRFGDRVIVEHPCFPLVLDLLEALGADVVGVPMDEEGIRPDALGDALQAPATAVILQPRAQNPTGVSLTPSRARELAEIIAATGTIIIEDDAAGSVSATPAISLGEWVPQQTLHVRSFSKSHGPDLRLAAMSGTTALIGEIVGRRQLGQGWSSRLLQRILLSLLTDPHAVEQINSARQAYARRRSLTVDVLLAHEITVRGQDGINIWVPVADESAAIVRLASQGIGATPGAPFAVLPAAGGHIRVTVGLLTERHTEVAEQIAAAARIGKWSGVR